MKQDCCIKSILDYIYDNLVSFFNNKNIYEEYDEFNQTKSVFIDMPKKISFDYVMAQKGSVEYHQHINSYIPRMRRLI